MILPAGFDDPECYAKELAVFVNSSIFQLFTVELHHLDVYLVDTLNDPWLKLPKDWQAWFEDGCMNLDEQEIRLQDIRMKGVSNLLGRPKTLSDFLIKLRCLALPRLQGEPSPTSPVNHDVVLSSDLLKGMSIKKRVEVVQFGKIVQDLAKRVDAKNAIDIGAGFGYLSRTISHADAQKPLHVLAIDGSLSQIEGSIALSGSPASQNLITYLQQRISSASSGRIEIERWLEERGPAVIVGLHCCGSLTDDLLSMFMQIKGIRGVAVVGCCFNHLRTYSTPAGPNDEKNNDDIDSTAVNFPSSDLLKSYNVHLSSTAKMAACQNVGCWAGGAEKELSEKEKEKREQKRSLSRRRNHYRRLFTRLLLSSHFPQESRPQLDTLRLGSIPTNILTSFALYSSHVLSKLDLLTEKDNKPLMEEAASIEERFCGWKWEARGRVIEALGQATGEVVESIIAIDRYLTLTKHPAVDQNTVGIIQTWAYKESPRNLIMVAQKILS